MHLATGIVVLLVGAAIAIVSFLAFVKNALKGNALAAVAWFIFLAIGALVSIIGYFLVAAAALG